MRQEKGRISIYDLRGRLLESRPYYSAYGRQTMMEALEEEYLYRASYFHIYPYALDPDVTKEKRKFYSTVPIADAPKKIKHHPAIYDNKQWDSY